MRSFSRYLSQKTDVGADFLKRNETRDPAFLGLLTHKAIPKNMAVSQRGWPVGRAWKKNRSDFYGWIFRRYPSFILSDQVERLDSIPVFVFHEVEKNQFESVLRYLAENRYRTLTCDDLYERLRSKKLAVEREVVLTFDDGHKSLWAVAYPLLKEYGFTGVAFVVPGLVPESHTGAARDRSYAELCTWGELRMMHSSGVVDVQAHSTYHHTVYISPRIIDYVSPTRRFLSLKGDIFPVMWNGSEVRLASGFPFGTPIFASAPRLGPQAQYLDSRGFRAACSEYVQRNGGREFFARPGWRNELDLFARRTFRSFAGDARYEAPDERCEAIRTDLASAKRILEHNLEGKRIRHFCFPWFTGSDLSVRISGDMGYVTNFWGGLVPTFAKNRSEPMAVPRLNPLYIWRLPGKGRVPAWEILKRRLREIGSGYGTYQET